MKKLWLRERDADPACWCPWELPATVVLGLNLIQLNGLGVAAYQEWQEET